MFSFLYKASETVEMVTHSSNTNVQTAGIAWILGEGGGGTVVGNGLDFQNFQREADCDAPHLTKLNCLPLCFINDLFISLVKCPQSNIS